MIFDFLTNIIDYTNKLKVLNFLKDKFNQNLINVIDIGGHKGETINFFLKNFNVNKIYVFEPNHQLFEILIRKFSKKVYQYKKKRDTFSPFFFCNPVPYFLLD